FYFSFLHFSFLFIILVILININNSHDIALDAAGNVHIVGNARAGNYDLDPGPGTLMQTRVENHATGFVLKLDTNGNLVWGGSLVTTDTHSECLGTTVDSSGNLYVTGQDITIFDPSGEPIASIGIPEPPANLTFGGRDGTTLFITARTSLYRVDMRVTGQ
ncbi:MAG TPA: hypothetical protein EYQ82_07690, partial [Dehalococcoidia bacterium]|nr:hypothetical protein [Dehalococcoidia bacterium]